MREDLYFDSCGAGIIHACRWAPEGAPKAILQIVHGIAEYVERYDNFAEYLTAQGYMVVAEDHMGHGKSIGKACVQGYFTGGWFSAVEDTCELMRQTKAEYPDLPYVLFGHSMGSFMARTVLTQYPDVDVDAAVICGTGWLPQAMLQMGISACKLVCRLKGEKTPSETLQGIVFGSYNRRVEHPRTAYDWINRDANCVDAYIADPLCGFTASAGLLRDMMQGILYIQQQKNLRKMRKDLPVLFIAGGDDPVGDYGSGVRKTAEVFENVGMTDISVRVYPLCRHEILNEINKEEIYMDVTKWLRLLEKRAQHTTELEIC